MKNPKSNMLPMGVSFDPPSYRYINLNNKLWYATKYIILVSGDIKAGSMPDGQLQLVTVEAADPNIRIHGLTLMIRDTRWERINALLSEDGYFIEKGINSLICNKYDITDISRYMGDTIVDYTNEVIQNSFIEWLRDCSLPTKYGITGIPIEALDITRKWSRLGVVN